MASRQFTEGNETEFESDLRENKEAEGGSERNQSKEHQHIHKL